MKICTPPSIFLILFIALILLNFSCSKDIDLLSKVILEDTADVDNYGTVDENGMVVNSIVLTPINDAYLQDVSSYDHSIMRIEENNRTSYLMFDLSSINGDITGANFQFTVNSDEGNGDVNVYKGADSNWNEDNLSTTNAPAIDIGIGAINKSYSLGATELIGITSSSLQSEKTTLILTHSNGNDLAIASKEHPLDIGPKLIVTYQLPQGVEDTAVPNSGESSSSNNSGSSGSSGSGDSGSSESGDSGSNTYDPPPNYGSLKAFPSAYGAGAYASGGRGGAVYVVTNLNDSGPGSFREAFEAQGTRTIVFAVSGTIKVNSSLRTPYGNVTVAGQTAPAGGITFTTDRTNIPVFEVSGVDNVIFRYIKVRPIYDNAAYSPYSNSDAMQFFDCTNIIVDHCSISWGADEGIETGRSSNVTFQNLLVAECAKGSIMGDGQQPELSDNLSALGNLWWQISHRHPNTVTNGRADVINNVIWGWGGRLNRADTGAPKLNEINNYYRHNTEQPLYNMNKVAYYSEPLNPDIYSKGNLFLPGTVTDPDLPNNNASWTVFDENDKSFSFTYNNVEYYDDDPPPADWFISTQHALVGHEWPIMTAMQALEYVKSETGANAYIDDNGNVITDVDALDAIYIADLNSGIASEISYPFTMSGKSHYESFFANYSNAPINTHPAGYDTDNDGMPDSWEVAKGLDPNTRDNNEDPDGNGYTNLEEFINLVDF